MRVYVAGQSINLDPSKSIGKGGEADVYDIGGGRALKLFKPPNHPDYTGQPAEQRAAAERIEQHQQKLRAFPRNLPTGVVTPVELATDRDANRILGYTMPFLQGTEVLMRYGNRGFRQAGVPDDVVMGVFKDLRTIVDGTHKAGVVIGDFNDLNVLVLGTEAHIIDADSFQFGGFLCRLFTARFVDPLLCDSTASQVMLRRPHNEDSDWYAFNIMLFQSLLFVDPYGGVYAPKNHGDKVAHDARSLRRITVFHSEVKYPKPARPYGVLPDEWLDYFHGVFEKDLRGPFPSTLLEAIRWIECTACGAIHARNVCPFCAFVAQAAVRETTTIRGQVMATRVFQTRGTILFATFQGDRLRWLYHENGQYKREDGSRISTSSLDPQMRFRIQGDNTIIAKGNQAFTLSKDGAVTDQLVTDCYGTLPIFDANEASRYWASGGQLMRDGDLGPEYIGDVLSGQTLFWVGPRFGFGFYRAGQISISFVFDAKKRGINDTVKLDPIRGQLLDSTCFFTKDRCWFVISTQEGGKIQNRCTIIRSDGSIEATAEATSDDGSWLGTIRGKCAVGNFMLAATDDGIVRLEADNDNIIVTKSFPDAEPFVDSSVHLFPGSDGLYVVSHDEIYRLKIS